MSSVIVNDHGTIEIKFAPVIGAQKEGIATAAGDGHIACPPHGKVVDHRHAVVPCTLDAAKHAFYKGRSPSRRQSHLQETLQKRDYINGSKMIE